MADDIFVRDGDGDLAVNTVVSTEANVPYNYDDCFTLDTNGRRALRVVGSGGGSGGVTSVNGKTGTVVLTGADLTTTVEIETATITQALASDTIYNCGEMTSIEITLPQDLDPKFIAQLNFTSGTTPTAFTAPNTIIWRGDSVATTFVPEASKRYTILFYYDGVQVRGIIQGV